MGYLHFLGSWTAFEACVSHIFSQITSKDDRLDIIEDMNLKIFNIIKKLDDSEIDNARNYFENSFIPVSRKFRFLRKLKAKDYSPDFSADLEFVNFCSQLRNCLIHKNGTYSGKGFKYIFHEESFEFVHGETLHQRGTNAMVFWEMAERFIEIFSSLTPCLEKFAALEYPEDRIFDNPPENHKAIS